MTTQQATVETSESSAFATMYKQAYRFLAYFGFFSVSASLLWGFSFDASAPAANYGLDVALYALFMVPHLVMTRSWFKRLIWGRTEGSPRERRFYISLAIVMWFAVITLHRPLPGYALALPSPWLTIMAFAGFTLFLMAVKLLLEGVTFSALDGLFGVPGSVSAYSHGPETPLFTEGRYATVRHPMYQSFILIGLASLLINPNTAQLLWVGMIGATFIIFLPIEEAQMIRARGDDYRAYMKQTPWRLFPGIW